MNNNDFDSIINRFEKITREFINNEFLKSEEYINMKVIANQIFNLTSDKSNMLLEVVKGNESGQIIGLPNSSAICFKTRFLGDDLLKSDIKTQLDKSIEDIYYFGFLQHQFLWGFPTRHKVNSVNIEDLFAEYYPKALIADIVLKGYMKDSSKTHAILKYYYDVNMEKFIKNELRIGFFKRVLCKSFFKNLYLSGALLGMEFDMKTN